MADYFTYFSVLFPVGSPENVQAALNLYQAFEVTLDVRGEETAFEAQADASPGSTSVWLYSDGQGDPDQVIDFVLTCAEALGLQGLWGFHWTHGCSRPRLDGAGSGGRVLDLGRGCTVDWMDSSEWLASRLAIPVNPRTPAQAILRPLVEEQGWNWTTVADLVLAFVDQEITHDPCAANRLRDCLVRAAAGPGQDTQGAASTPGPVLPEGTAHQGEAARLAAAGRPA